MENQLSERQIKNLKKEQCNEITAHHVYKNLSRVVKDEHNSEILKSISEEELGHYKQLKTLTGTEVKPNWRQVTLYRIMAKVLGFTFSVKLFEMTEDNAEQAYDPENRKLSLVRDILSQEEEHEQKFIEMLDEERLNYMGSIVLGLNDALVELTGALAGYTFAFQDTKLIALTGLITGISASFSMAASEYLSSKQEGDTGEARKSSLYTGIAYIFTVIFLILPFLLIGNPFVSLVTSLVVAVVIIFVFNYYVSVAKSLNFKKRFLEMASISLGVAAISFVIGIIVKNVFGVDI